MTHGSLFSGIGGSDMAAVTFLFQRTPPVFKENEIMIKSLVTGGIVAIQIYLINSIGTRIEPQLLLLVLLLAAIPFLREPAIRGFEDMEKERANRKRKEGEK